MHDQVHGPCVLYLESYLNLYDQVDPVSYLESNLNMYDQVDQCFTWRAI